MKVAILARGGSIWRTWAEADRSQYDRVITINTACNVFACDFVAACDSHTYDAIQYLPSFGYIYRSDLPREWEKVHALLGPELRGIDMSPLVRQYPAGIKPEFSIESAIVYAVEDLGAESVDLYGVDLAKNEKEIPGVKVNATAQRWAKEQRALDRMMAHYSPRVKRIL